MREILIELDLEEITTEIRPIITKNKLNHWLITIEFIKSGQNGRMSKVDSPNVILEPIDPRIIIEVSENNAEIICKFAKEEYFQSSGPNLTLPTKYDDVNPKAIPEKRNLL